MHVGGELIEQAEPEVRVGLARPVYLARFVAQVVGEPGEAVQRGQVPSVAFGEQPQRDGKVLAGGVGHDLLGTGERRADMLSHAGPVRSVAAPGHPVIFQGMHN